MNNILCALGNDYPRCRDFGLLLLRLFFGGVLAVMHGWAKLPISQDFVDGVAALGFPMPVLFAWSAALSELVGGLLLVLGLLTRPAALLIFITMTVAALMQHAADPFHVKELAFAYGTAALALVFTGAGRFSLDHLLLRSSTLPAEAVPPRAA